MTLLLLLKPRLGGVSIVANQAFFNFDNDRAYQFEDSESSGFSNKKSYEFEKNTLTKMLKSSKLKFKKNNSNRFKK